MDIDVYFWICSLLNEGDPHCIPTAQVISVELLFVNSCGLHVLCNTQKAKTPLMCAVEAKQVDIVNYLLEIPGITLTKVCTFIWIQKY